MGHLRPAPEGRPSVPEHESALPGPDGGRGGRRIRRPHRRALLLLRQDRRRVRHRIGHGEGIYGFVRNGVAIEILGGKNGRKWAGFLATLFVFILIQNLWGIVPVAQLPVTSHFAIPVLLAVMVWFIYMIVGIQKHGFFGFFKLMCYIPGIPIAMHLLLIPIEFLSNIILRPFTLAIRLFANMFAGHMLITIAAFGTVYLWGEGGFLNYVLGTLPFIGSLGLVFFELLIISLQAYVFVLLTAIYLESSLADSH